jgi:aminoglycoside 6'-N-acetyltransferase I
LVTAADDAEWLRMRGALWPDVLGAQHRVEMERYRATPEWAVLVADRGDGRLGGFLELGQRSFADGCESSPVPYIEGWYVDADLRRGGVGRMLVEAAERLAIERGFTEIASDCVVENTVSAAAHHALGYEVVHRSIQFRKRLK